MESLRAQTLDEATAQGAKVIRSPMTLGDDIDV